MPLCGKSEGDENHKRGGLCAKMCRWLLFAAAIVAMVMSGITLTSCNFLNVTYDEEFDIEDIPFKNNTTDLNIGLFRYDPTDGGCRAFSNDDLVSVELTSARIAGCVALGFAFVGLLLLWTEFICCRFCGGRFLEGICFVGASLSQAATFLIFGSTICTLDLSKAYPCSLQTGGILSIIATFAYLACSLLICCTPKPEPMCVSLKEQDHNDPCCCFQHKKTSEHAENGDDVEQPTAAPIEPSTPQPEDPAVAAAVVVGYEEEPSYRPDREPSYRTMYTPPEEEGHTEETMSYWPTQNKSEEAEYSSGTHATLPPYRDVAFVDSEAFFDTDTSTKL